QNVSSLWVKQVNLKESKIKTKFSNINYKYSVVECLLLYMPIVRVRRHERQCFFIFLFTVIYNFTINSIPVCAGPTDSSITF
ncbi:unnamed protein product, partial [Nesidiocoris tenuis]